MSLPQIFANVTDVVLHGIEREAFGTWFVSPAWALWARWLTPWSRRKSWEDNRKLWSESLGRAPMFSYLQS